MTRRASAAPTNCSSPANRRPRNSPIAQEFLQQPATKSGMTAWEEFAQALLATNEMLYVD